MTTDRFTAEQLSLARQAREDRTPRRLSLLFGVGLGVFIVLGLTTGIGQRESGGESLPPPPARVR
jgi:hypothetical protein